MDLSKMVAASNEKSTHSSTNEPGHFPNTSDSNNAIIDTHRMYLNTTKWRKLKPSLPPQHNSRITLTLEEAMEYELKHGRQVDRTVDMKHLRRTVSNRLSALRSRMKRSQHIKDMEKMVKDLEAKISILTPQIEIFKEKRKQLLLEHDSLLKSREIRFNEARISEILLQQKQLEISRLKEVAQTMNYNSHCLRFNQTACQPYNLELYQNSLQKFEVNEHSQEQVSSSVVVRIGPEYEEKAHEDEDIDQYLNFDELNIHPTI